MLQNEAEMYNLGIVGNARYCNGHVQVADGMAPKKDHKSRKGKMVPSKDDIPSPASPLVDGRLKFSDRLKALLKSGGTLKEDVEPEDPYAFSEPEPQVLRLYQKPNTNNCYSSKKCVALTSKLCQVASKTAPETGDASGQLYGMNMARLYPALSHDIATDSVVVDDDSSKTMNRLQAKIAQSKVIGKHKKVHSSSPSPELLNARKRERSLLEEQLLGLNSDMPVKKEPASPPVSSSSRHTITYKPQLNNSSHSVVVMLPAKRRRSKTNPQNERLRRVQCAQNALRDYKQDLYPLGVEVSESEESDLDEETGIFQRHWFFGCGEQGACGDGQREGRLTQMRTELRRKLGQMWGGMPVQYGDMLVGALIKSARTHPSQSALLLRSQGRRCQSHVRQNRSKLTMLVKRVCSYRKGESDACSSLALPCTQHCVRHIMYNVDQLLFEHCTAKFSDNTQCCVPVFDICHELPLCLEHARKRDNYDRMCAETKPKKVRKKAKPSAMTRPSKRGKKKRRMQRLSEPTPMEETVSQHLDACDVNGGENSSPSDGFEPYIKEEIVENSSTPEPQQMIEQEHHDVPVVEEEVVLSMAEELPLDPVELANQASRLLEEHELTNVLNQIPADAFNDLFTEDKNGEYEPTREETEELERALEAVDKDVKSLEKLSQTQGLLDTLIDEHTLVQTLSQLPEVPALSVPGIVPVFTSYHNGFVVNSHTAAPVDSKSLSSHSSESPAVLTHPTISIQTQTDMPS